MEPVDSLQSQTIERKWQMRLQTNGLNDDHRYACLGKFSADFELMQMVLSDDPANTEQHRMLLRGHSHKRGRGDESRFNSPITVSLEERSITEDTGIGAKIP